MTASIPTEGEPGSQEPQVVPSRQTGLIVLTWVLVVACFLPGLWIIVGPVGIGTGFAATRRGDPRGGAAMVAAGVAMIIAAVVTGLFV